MTFLKKFIYHLAASFHKLFVLLLPLVFAISILASSPKYIEHALKESNVYDQFVPMVLDKSRDQASDQDSKELLADPGIKAAAEKAFTPQLLQTSAENVINGVFAWMQGLTTEPQFTIDLTSARTELGNNIAAYAEKRAKSLPTCTLQQLRTMSPDIDLLQIPCVPPGVDVSALAQQYSQKFLNDSDFLKDPVITSQTITKNNGRSLADQLRAVPPVYHALNVSRWILLGVVLLLTALLIFARRNKRAGVKHVAWTLIGVATFLVIYLIIYWFVFDHATTARAATNVDQALWTDGAKALIHDFNKIILWFSAGYIALGSTALVTLRFWPKQPTQTQTDTPQPETATEVPPAEPVEEPEQKTE